MEREVRLVRGLFVRSFVFSPDPDDDDLAFLLVNLVKHTVIPADPDPELVLSPSNDIVPPRPRVVLEF